MMRSLFSGVAGLRNHQTGMDVIGANISNVNTVGYKGSRSNFSDVISQTMQGAASATGNRGGTNPIQVGLGMGLAAVDTIMTSGSYQPTGKQTDLAIQNQGFFIVSDGLNQYYTRAGAFDFDSAGNYVVPGTGMKVMGWLGVDGVVDTSGQVSNIVVPAGVTLPAVATSKMTFINNLSGSDTPGASAQTSLEVYDSLGKVQTLQDKFIKVGDNKWLSKASLTDSTIAVENALTEITFDTAGKISTVKQVVARPENVPSNSVQMTNGMRLVGTVGSTSTSNFTLLDASGAEQSYSMEFVNTTANTAWTYTIKNSAGESVGAGTVAYAAPNYTFVAGATTPFSPFGTPILPVNTLGAAPGAFSGAVNSPRTSTSLAFANTMQLDSTVAAVHTQSFTLTNAAGANETFSIEYTTTAANAWDYEIFDSAGNSKGDGTVAYGTGYTFTAGADFSPYGVVIDPTNASGVIPAAGAFSSGLVDPYTTTALSIPSIQLDNTSGSVHNAYYTVFDQEHTPHVLQMKFTQTATNNWTYELTEAGSTSTTALLAGNVTWTPPAGAVLGKYTYTPAFSASPFSIGTGAALTSITLSTSPTSGVAPSGNSFTAASAATYVTSTTVNPVTFTPPGAAQSTVTMDVSGITQYGGSTSVQASSQNGNAAGALDTVTIDTSGMIVGKFSNGKTQNLARVALATFVNPGGLSRVGDTIFAVSNNSGNPSIGTSGTGGRGTLTPGTLEMSNIDLADQFSKMIITQRGFQANSKIITTSDTMLEELVNLKR